MKRWWPKNPSHNAGTSRARSRHGAARNRNFCEWSAHIRRLVHFVFPNYNAAFFIPLYIHFSLMQALCCNSPLPQSQCIPVRVASSSNQQEWDVCPTRRTFPLQEFIQTPSPGGPYRRLRKLLKLHPSCTSPDYCS